MYFLFYPFLVLDSLQFRGREPWDLLELIQNLSDVVEGDIACVDGVSDREEGDQ